MKSILIGMPRLRRATRSTLFLCLALLFPAQAVLAQASCDVRLSPAVVDYGQSTRGALLAQRTGPDEVSLGQRRSALHVQCPHDRPIAVSFTAAAADGDRFKFGDGTLQVRIVAAQADGVPVQLGRQGGGNAGAAEIDLRPGDKIVPVRDGVPAVGRNFYFEFDVDARLAPDATRVNQPTTFEVQGRFRAE